MNQKILDAIASCYVFESLDPATTNQVAEACYLETIDAGELIFSLGDEADGMRIVLDGLVRIWMDDGQQGERTLRYLGPGDVFGEIALIDGLVRTTSVSTEDTTQCVFLPHAAFLKLAELNTPLNRHLMLLLCERLRNCIEDIGYLSFLNVRERLCHKIYDLAFDYARLSDGHAVFTRKFSQAALAKMIGASREAANRQVMALIRDGIMSVDEGIITVHSIQKLERMFTPMAEITPQKLHNTQI